jgi:hypothetical protein
MEESHEDVLEGVFGECHFGADVTAREKTLIPHSRRETGLGLISGRAAKAASHIRNFEYLCTTLENSTDETQQRR